MLARKVIGRKNSLHFRFIQSELDNHFPSWIWLSNNQTLPPSAMEAKWYKMRVSAFSQNSCEHRNFPFVETGIFQELRKLCQDGNAMAHRLLVLLMGNETKTVAWRELALAGNRTRASRVAGENSTTEPQVLLCIRWLVTRVPLLFLTNWNFKLITA